MDAAIVELDALADPVRPAAQDDDLAPVGRPASHSALLADDAGLVAGVDVGRARLELGGAGVDALEHRPDAQRRAGAGAPRPRRRPVSSARRASEKPFGLERRAGLGVVRQALRADLAPRSRRAPRSGAGTRDRSGRRAAISADRQALRGTPGRSAAAGRASAAPAPPGRVVRRSSPASPSISISSRPGEARSPASAAPSAAIPGRSGRSPSPRPPTSSRW